MLILILVFNIDCEVVSVLLNCVYMLVAIAWIVDHITSATFPDCNNESVRLSSA